MNTLPAKKYRIIFIFLAVTALISTLTLDTLASELVGTDTPTIDVVSPYLSIEYRTLVDGTQISGYIINGPREPLPEYEAERAASIQPLSTTGVIPDFPSFNWVFGCSAVSGAMIAGYYDRGAYPDMYTGPTNGGVMPLTDTSWPTWTDVNSDPYPNNPLIASHMGVDGLATKGSIDDYWIQYGSTANDPYITGSWTQHTWGSAIGDFMKTSQSAYGNSDGSTAFYNWTTSPDQLTCADMAVNQIDDVDGTYGRKLFYEARGYTVTDCYNQKTDNNGGGFTLAMFQAEINAGHPVLLNLAGHSIVGYGYSGSTVYIRDTWDNNPTNTYTMPWGGSYEGMELLSVSVVKLAPPAPPTMATHLPFVLRRVMPNQSPTDILLSNNTIEEHQPINTVVGTFSTIDPNGGDTFTYNLVSGPGDSGNSAFNIAGNQLRSSVIFDYAQQNSYSIRVRSTDQDGAYFEKIFSITIIQESNLPPTNIQLSNSSIPESQPINTVVGALSTTDPDVGDTFTYTLVSGAGDTGNGSFNISGNQLRSSVIFDYESQNSYSVRIRTTDQGGLYFEKAFTITITDVAESTILNGDFEQGPVAWNEYSSHGFPLIYLASDAGVTAHSGEWIAWLGGADYETSSISQPITVPIGSDQLHFWYWIGSEDLCGYDFFVIWLDATPVFIQDLCYDENTYGWVEGVVDLSSYSGSAYTLEFWLENDYSGISGLLLDDISFSSRVASQPSVNLPNTWNLDSFIKLR